MNRMTSRIVCLVLGASSLALVACGEKDQSQAKASKKSELSAWAGSQTEAFNAPGYKGGDQTQWQSQLRTRAQSQNEYVRAR